MKTTTIILGLALFTASCGEDHQAKVCECKVIYDEVSLKAEQAEAAGGNWSEAQSEAIKATNGKFEECDKFHTEVVSDQLFYELGKNCK